MDSSSIPSCLICCARARLASWMAGRVQALPLGFGDLVARRVLLALQPFDLRNEPTARVSSAAMSAERLVRIQPAIAQAASRLLPDDHGRMTDRACTSMAGRFGLMAASCVLAAFHERGPFYMRSAPLASGRFLCYDAGVTSIVRKAVFPAAGLGTRFLPATKAQPKEMLPLVDKPIIQYGVEEAVASGIDNIILVTGRGKNAIEDHFDVSVELESFLEARGKREQLDEVRKISNMINFAYVRQGEPLGLGHAVLVDARAGRRRAVRRDPGRRCDRREPPAIKQMIDVFAGVDGPVLAVERVPRDEISSYGVIAVEPIVASATASYRVRDLVEKPPRDEAPSNLAIIGRYILTPDIFPALAATQSDRTGEIQLTNGLRELLKSRPIYACEVKGVRHDTGNKLGFLKAVVYFALRRPDLADKFSAYLASLDLETPAVKR